MRLILWKLERREAVLYRRRRKLQAIFAKYHPQFDAVIMGAAVKRSSKLFNESDASCIPTTQLVRWYDLIGEVVRVDNCITLEYDSTRRRIKATDQSILNSRIMQF